MKEKALFQAMQVRYSADSSKSRNELNELYAEAMKKAYRQFPTDHEISTLYADALMLLHPWNLWEHNGTAKAWTPEIMKVLENTLRYAPDHPGANHYYIHTVEASPFPWKAAKSADRLGSLTPGLSHMVHMPSHIYIRTGQYEKGIKVNTEAVSQYDTYKQLYPDVMNNAPLYEYHNRHMQAACSMNGTDFSKAIKDAGDCRNSFDTSFMSLPVPIGNYIQYVYMTPVFTLVTFKKWDELLSQPAIADHHPHALALKHFSEGMAYANTNQPGKAAASLSGMEALLDNESLAIPFGPFNAPKAGITVAKHILMGAIAENSNKPEEAIMHYQEAVKTEDAMIYDEPKDWLLPSRHFLGNLLLERKKYTEAEKVFRQDLKNHPNNYTSTKGLEVCMQKKGKKA
jgi:tetratricopeptide (TPR) repeat protein